MRSDEPVPDQAPSAVTDDVLADVGVVERAVDLDQSPFHEAPPAAPQPPPAVASAVGERPRPGGAARLLLDLGLGDWRMAASLVASSIAIGSVGLAMPLAVMTVVDRVLVGQARHGLAIALAAAVIAGIAEAGLRFVRDLMRDGAASSSNADKRPGSTPPGDRFGGRRPPPFVDAAPRPGSDRPRIAATLELPFVLLAIGLLFVIAVSLGLVVLAAMLAAVALLTLLAPPTERLADDIERLATEQQRCVAEAIATQPDLVAVGGVNAFAAGQAARTNAVADARSRLARMASIAARLYTLVELGATAALLALGAGLVEAGAVSPGGLVATLLLGWMALRPLPPIVAELWNLRSSIAAEAAEAQDDFAVPPQQRHGAAERVILDSAVELLGVSLTHPRKIDLMLRGVSFAVHSGERVALVGGNGAGKSAILELILALRQPSSGAVLLDGQDIAHGAGTDLSGIGYLPQETVLLRGSIRRNIALRVPDASDDEIRAAAELAGACPFIDALPHGLDTGLGDLGRGLSASERRGIALARALLGRPRLLLLDEPTRDMDARSEIAFVARMRRGLDGQTLVLVSYRPAPLALVDRLIVIKDGRIVADGAKSLFIAPPVVPLPDTDLDPAAPPDLRQAV